VGNGVGVGLRVGGEMDPPFLLVPLICTFHQFYFRIILTRSAQVTLFLMDISLRRIALLVPMYKHISLLENHTKCQIKPKMPAIYGICVLL
jgi:hypothetical protein